MTAKTSPKLKVFAKVIHGANRVPQLAVDGNIFPGFAANGIFYAYTGQNV